MPPSTNDLQSGYSPDESTPPSRNLDVAALYFPLPVAGGGSGGYLPSDNVPNTWLSGSALKMLVGYPVDGSQFGNAGVVPGQMYQTAPQIFPFSLAQDPVMGQQEVYTAPWLLSYPGNSGGPVYVQFNGAYYPAAVYLGTLFSGSQPFASVVRGIDSNVVNLINLAAILGVNGTNFSGGGVINVVPGQEIAAHPGLVEVTIAPPAAAQAGGAWKFSNLSDAQYSTRNPSALAVSSTNLAQLQFKPIPGWNLPTNQSLSVSAGSVNTLTSFYTLAVTWATPSAITYGTVLGSNQLNASVPALTNGASANFTYSPPGGTILSTGVHTLSVTFTPDDTADYGSASAGDAVSLTVLPALLTVTVDNFARGYGQSNPVFTGTIAGLQNGDNITVSYSCAATTNSPAGEYAIQPSLVDPDDLETNYLVTMAPGTLTVTAPATVPPKIQSAAQSGGTLTFTWSTVPNQAYQIQTATDLTQTTWTTLTNGNTGANSTMTTSEPIGATGRQYYRVVLVP